MFIPPRKSNAMTGSQFARSMLGINGPIRENAIFIELMNGNVAEFLRIPVHVASMDERIGMSLTYTVMPRFLAIGSNDDHLYIPMAPGTAQGLADAWGAFLPTYKMVQDIFRFASFRLIATPMRFGPLMTSTDYYWQHSNLVCAQLNSVPQQALCDGYKKNVIISKRMETNRNSVFIYGWMKDQSGNFWQGLPLYPGHDRMYADYSHGIRMVDRQMMLTNLNDETSTTVDAFDVLKDPNLCHLLSAEGPILIPRY